MGGREGELPQYILQSLAPYRDPPKEHRQTCFSARRSDLIPRLLPFLSPFCGRQEGGLRHYWEH